MASTRPPLALLRPSLANAHAYVPAQGDFRLRLDANEAPNFWSEAAQQALAKAAMRAPLSSYPDATQTSLRQAIAGFDGGKPNEYLVGVGSDELIALLLTACAKPGASILCVRPSFVIYEAFAALRDYEVTSVELTEDWQLPVDALTSALKAKAPALVFLPSPNNPTGNSFVQAAIERLVSAYPNTLWVLDEAYRPYADESFRDWPGRYPQVLLLGTLSKIGLAGLRVGWCRGQADLIAELNKVRAPFNLNGPSQAMAECAITTLAGEIEQMCAEIRTQRSLCKTELEGLGLGVTPSQANFHWVNTGERKARDLAARLAEKHEIAVRHFHKYGGRMEHQLRIGVGTKRQNELFFEALRDCLGLAGLRFWPFFAPSYLDCSRP